MSNFVENGISVRPNEGATAPWPLRAIKEAPRHLYQDTKNAKRTL